MGLGSRSGSCRDGVGGGYQRLIHSSPLPHTARHTHTFPWKTAAQTPMYSVHAPVLILSTTNISGLCQGSMKALQGMDVPSVSASPVPSPEPCTEEGLPPMLLSRWAQVEGEGLYMHILRLRSNESDNHLVCLQGASQHPTFPSSPVLPPCKIHEGQESQDPALTMSLVSWVTRADPFPSHSLSLSPQRKRTISQS